MIVLPVTPTPTARLQLPLAVVGHAGSTILVALNGPRLLARRRGPPDRVHPHPATVARRQALHQP